MGVRGKGHGDARLVVYWAALDLAQAPAGACSKIARPWGRPIRQSLVKMLAGAIDLGNKIAWRNTCLAVVALLRHHTARVHWPTKTLAPTLRSSGNRVSSLNSYRKLAALVRPAGRLARALLIFSGLSWRRSLIQPSLASRQFAVRDFLARPSQTGRACTLSLGLTRAPATGPLVVARGALLRVSGQPSGLGPAKNNKLTKQSTFCSLVRRYRLFRRAARWELSAQISGSPSPFGLAHN